MKNLNVFLLFLCLTLLCGHAFAQTSSRPKIKLGLRAGVNISKLAITGTEMEDYNKDNTKHISSFQFGTYADVLMSTSFSIQPGLFLSGKGGEIQLSEVNTQLGPPSITGSMKYEMMYIEIPINAVYRFHNFYVGAGPYAAVALSGKYKSELTSTASGQTAMENRDIIFGNEEVDDLKRSDFGLNILAGYELKNGFNLGINYGLGLNKLDPSKGSYNRQNRVASISLGFAF